MYTETCTQYACAFFYQDVVLICAPKLKKWMSQVKMTTPRKDGGSGTISLDYCRDDMHVNMRLCVYYCLYIFSGGRKGIYFLFRV